jgi:DNA polymerase III subunit delta
MEYFKAIAKDGMKDVLKRNAIVLHGEQEVLMEEILGKIIEAMVDNNFKDFDYITFDHRSDERPFEIKEVIEQLEAFPFGSQKKAVSLKGGEELSGDHKGYLANYITSIPSSSIFILIFKGKNLPLLLGSKLEKALKNNATFINCSIKSNEIVKWIIEKAAKDNGKTIGQEESKFLLNRVGTDLREITNELKKLSCFAEPTFRITKESIELCCHQHIQTGVFELIDSIGLGQTLRGITIFSDLMKQQEEPLRIMALLGNHFNLIRQIRELKEKKIPDREIISLFQKIGEHPFRIQKAIENSCFSLESLKKAQKWLLEADISIKTGRQEPEIIIELLIIMLCQEARKKKKRYQ